MIQVHHVPACLRPPSHGDGILSSEPGGATTTTTTGEGGAGTEGGGVGIGTGARGGLHGSLKESGKAVVQGPSQGALQAIRAMHKSKGQGQGQGHGKNQGKGNGPDKAPGAAVAVDGKHGDPSDGKMEIELKPLSEMKIIGIRTPQMTQAAIVHKQLSDKVKEMQEGVEWSRPMLWTQEDEDARLDRLAQRKEELAAKAAEGTGQAAMQIRLIHPICNPINTHPIY